MMSWAETAILFQSTVRAERAAGDVERAVRLHGQFVYRVAYSLLRNHHDAEDASQETFLRLLRYRSRLEQARNPRAFLARVAWRVALDRLRRRRLRAEVPLEDLVEAVRALQAQGRNVEEIAASRQMQALLERLILSLPGKLRDAFTLSTLDEMKGSEVAELLKIPEASVRTRIFRARHLLQEKLLSLLGTKEERRP